MDFSQTRTDFYKELGKNCVVKSSTHLSQATRHASRSFAVLGYNLLRKSLCMRSHDLFLLGKVRKKHDGKYSGRISFSLPLGGFLTNPFCWSFYNHYLSRSRTKSPFFLPGRYFGKWLLQDHKIESEGKTVLLSFF